MTKRPAEEDSEFMKKIRNVSARVDEAVAPREDKFISVDPISYLTAVSIMLRNFCLCDDGRMVTTLSPLCVAFLMDSDAYVAKFNRRGGPTILSIIPGLRAEYGLGRVFWPAQVQLKMCDEKIYTIFPICLDNDMKVVVPVPAELNKMTDITQFVMRVVASVVAMTFTQYIENTCTVVLKKD